MSLELGQIGAKSNIDRPAGVHYKMDKWKVKIPNVGVRWIAGQTAKPFMTPAYLHAKNTGEVEQEVVKSVQTDIKKLESGKK